MRLTTLRLAFGGALVALAACGGAETRAPDTAPAPTTEPAAAAAPEPAAPAAPAAETAPAPAPEPTYLPGKFVWYELQTPKVAEAKAFYAELLGWQIETAEMGGFSFELIKSGGTEIGLIVAPQPAAPVEGKKAKKPAKQAAHWLPYVSVPDVDAAATKVAESGGTVVSPAADIPNIGRYAVVTGPSGAQLALFKNQYGDAPDAMPAPGAWVWVELWTKNKKDSARAADFWTGVVGYQHMEFQGADVLSMNEMPRASIAKAPQGKLAGTWVPFVAVAKVDDTVKAARKLGAKVIEKPFDMKNVGRIALLRDPTGAVFGVMTPEAPSAESQAAPQADADGSAKAGAATAGEPSGATGN